MRSSPMTVYCSKTKKSSCVSVNKVKANGRDRDYRVHTQTGKPGKMGKHFPVREKSGNFVSPEKWEPWIRDRPSTGPPEAHSGRGAREHALANVKWVKNRMPPKAVVLISCFLPTGPNQLLHIDPLPDVTR